jgi:hypothetical protein
MTRNFTAATQYIYSHHPVYKFDPNDNLTSIMIHPAFADVDAPGQMAKIMFRAGGYDGSLNDYLGDNLIGYESDETGNVIGEAHSKMLNSTMTVLVQAYSEMESQDIADELAQLMSYGLKEVYAKYHIHVTGIQVGETSPLKDTEGSFQTMITVAYSAYLVMARRYGTMKVVDIEIDPDYDKTAGERFPGVFAFQETNRPNRE